MAIIRSTTPTVKYNFKVVNVENIVKAYLTVRQDDSTIIEKDLSTAEVGETSISWRLSQEETRQIASGKATIMMNWLTADGTRGASKAVTLVIDPNLKDEVI